MRKILIPACVVVWSSVAVYAVADVAVYDSTVKTAVDNVKAAVSDADTHITDAVNAADTNITNAVNKQASGANDGTYTPTGAVSDHGATEHGSLRANQVRQMDLMQGDRDKTKAGTVLEPLAAKDRDYLNLTPDSTTYSGSGSSYATSVNLPSKYCTDITVTAATSTTPASYACTGTAGFKGSTGSTVGGNAIDSTAARKNLIVDFSGATNNAILEESAKASELYAQRIAIYQAMAQEAYYRTTSRYTKLQDILDDIKNSKEPKEILDLQARFQSEQVMLQNEQNQLLALGQLQQSERDMYEQKKIELNNFRKAHADDKNSSSYSTGKVAAITGVTVMNTALIAASDSATVNTVLAGAGAVAAFSAFY